MKRRKLFCLLLAAVMLFSLAACGKGEDETKDPNLLKVGDYELLYKGASIMKDREGNDALVLTLDFTNNSEETTDYFWAIYETVMQNDTELETRSLSQRGNFRGRGRQPVSECGPRRHIRGPNRL